MKDINNNRAAATIGGKINTENRSNKNINTDKEDTAMTTNANINDNECTIDLRELDEPLFPAKKPVKADKYPESRSFSLLSGTAEDADKAYDGDDSEEQAASAVNNLVKEIDLSAIPDSEDGFAPYNFDFDVTAITEWRDIEAPDNVDAVYTVRFHRDNIEVFRDISSKALSKYDYCALHPSFVIYGSNHLRIRREIEAGIKAKGLKVTPKIRYICHRPGWVMFNGKACYCLPGELLTPNGTLQVETSYDTGKFDSAAKIGYCGDLTAAPNGVKADSLPAYHGFQYCDRLAMLDPVRTLPLFLISVFGVALSLFREAGTGKSGILYVVGEPGTRKSYCSALETQLFNRTDTALNNGKSIISVNNNRTGILQALNGLHDQTAILDDLPNSKNPLSTSRNNKVYADIIRQSANSGTYRLRDKTYNIDVALVITAEYIQRDEDSATERCLILPITEPIGNALSTEKGFEGENVLRAFTQQNDPRLYDVGMKAFLEWLVKNHDECVKSIAQNYDVMKDHDKVGKQRHYNTAVKLKIAGQLFYEFALERGFIAESVAKDRIRSVMMVMNKIIDDNDDLYEGLSSGACYSKMPDIAMAILRSMSDPKLGSSFRREDKNGSDDQTKWTMSISEDNVKSICNAFGVDVSEKEIRRCFEEAHITKVYRSDHSLAKNNLGYRVFTFTVRQLQDLITTKRPVLFQYLQH